jgi:hypothetical protein
MNEQKTTSPEKQLALLTAENKQLKKTNVVLTAFLIIVFIV